jgi:threonine/homoserine efflux transporter RhtA
MVFILFIVVCLVVWALYLMQEAVQRREFSLMLAGVLVSSAAAALVGVYFLMGHYVGYMTEMTERAALYSQTYSVSTLPFNEDWSEELLNSQTVDVLVR